MPKPQIIIIETPDLGDRSYVVGLGSTAVVVDPQRDIDRVYAVLAEHPDWTVTHVIETHMHNDYVSGGLVLAEELSAGYVVPVGHDYQFSALEMGEGDTFESGDMSWRVLHTPGHTPTTSPTRSAWTARTRRCSPADRCCSAVLAVPT